MWTRSVLDDKLNDHEKFSPVTRLPSGDIIEQDAHKFLSFLVHPLIRPHLTRPHGSGELMLHSHQGDKLGQQSIPELLPPVCTQQHRDCPSSEDGTGERPPHLRVRESLQGLQ